jgi:tetratricopeptide (TPR) repeat protein
MSASALTTPASSAVPDTSSIHPSVHSSTLASTRDNPVRVLWSLLREQGFDAALRRAAEPFAAGVDAQLHADLCASAGHFEAAYHSASQGQPVADGARYARLALFAEALGRTGAAELYSERAVSLQTPLATLEWIAWLMNGCGALAAAAHLLRAYERHAPADARGPWWLAIALAGLPPEHVRTERREALLRAHALSPSIDEALPLQVALAWREVRNWPAVERVCREALARNPADAEMAWQLSHAQWQRNDAAAAEATMRAVQAAAPGNPQVLAAIGMYLNEQARYDESEAILHETLGVDPQQVQAAVDLADLELRRNAWSLAWPRFEARLAREDRGRNNVVTLMADFAPRWRGEPLAGKTLVVHSEQGSGDDIHMVRFVPHLAAWVRASGGRLVLAVRRPLQSLFARFYADCVAIEGSSFAGTDYILPMMSLPRVLGLLPAQVSGGAYLHADPQRLDPWRVLVRASAPDARLHVGLVWSGSPTHRRDSQRSIPLDALKPLLALPGVAFHPLTPGRAADVAALAGQGYRVRDLTAHYEAGFDDVAAHLRALDALVTIDSAPLHLGGALGHPVFAMLDHVSHWSWGNEESQAWYDSVRLFRQPRPGAWAEVVERVVAQVQSLPPRVRSA